MSAPKRQPVNFEYQELNWDFIKLLGKVAHYAHEKYGSVQQYTDGRMEGEKSPLNHIIEHFRQYVTQEPHDHFTDTKYHLAAIAYNAMMEFYFLENGGPTASRDVYEPIDGRVPAIPEAVIEKKIEEAIEEAECEPAQYSQGFSYTSEPPLPSSPEPKRKSLLDFFKQTV
jgi:hypothetical protein